MSEKLHNQSERHESAQTEFKKHHESLKKNIEKEAAAAKHEHAKNLENIRSKIETEAAAKHEHDKDKDDPRKESSEQQPTFINKELKQVAYQRTLRRTQSKLSVPSRTLSKVVHHPTVEAVSEIAGKTIARPSGILAGGIFAFLGSSFFLWMARHYGFQYNFLLLTLFFIGGFFLGLLVELMIRLFKK